MDNSFIEDILILAKTYPSPSARYAETSCVAGINRQGKMRRIFPVPFRMMENEQQFKKWQWINARIYPSNNDRRPESHKIYTSTIKRGESIPTTQAWQLRKQWINQIPTNTQNGETLYLAKPKSIGSLEITAEQNQDWTQAELDKLLQLQNQGDLFETPKDIKQLRKIPYNFYYHYTVTKDGQDLELKHKIVDWEVGALYWNSIRSHGTKNWEKPFRDKLERELTSKDLMLLMGNIHRFQEQWLIISLIYPPKIKQQSLF